MEETTIDNIFKYLQKWRNFPKYQLERRLDIFIAMYLPEILQKCAAELKNIDINMDDIYPEFPLKKDKENDCSSDNVDFAVFGKEIKTIYLVELKTDMNSINTTQLKYYKDAKEKSGKNIETILNGILKIENKSPQWRKYDALLNDLIYKKDEYPKKNRQWKIDAIKDNNKYEDFQNKIASYDKVKIIYIIPKDIETIKDEKVKELYKKLDPITITFKKIINELNNSDSNDAIRKKLLKLLDLISGEQIDEN